MHRRASIRGRVHPVRFTPNLSHRHVGGILKEKSCQATDASAATKAILRARQLGLAEKTGMIERGWRRRPGSARSAGGQETTCAVEAARMGGSGSRLTFVLFFIPFIGRQRPSERRP